jgi:general secretion pathway protein G
MTRDRLRLRFRTRARAGFTLVELLVVIVVIGILVGLLVPAIYSAYRNAQAATVTAEMNVLTQSISAFKTRYGDIPPSRVILAENGNYAALLADTTKVVDGDADSPMDQTVAQLAQRTLRVMRKFFPRVKIATSGATTYAYDFNGNGTIDTRPYILEGPECLVFFLGGIPSSTGTSLAGFAKDPTNPFRGDGTGGTTNRDSPFFDFRTERLCDDDGDGIPGYTDPLTRPTNATNLGDGRYYAYFATYGQNEYDPNDCNFAVDSAGRYFGTTFAVADPMNSGNPSNVVLSPSPNPYTTSPAIQAGRPTAYQNPQSFQIISAGQDRLYGIGGSYEANAPGDRLTLDGEVSPPNGDTPIKPAVDIGLRAPERDNLANFASGRLE